MARNCPDLPRPSRSRSRARAPEPLFMQTLRDHEHDTGWVSARGVWHNKQRDSTEEERKEAEHRQTKQFLDQLPKTPIIDSPAYWSGGTTEREHRVRAPPTGQSIPAALEEEEETEHLDYSDMESCPSSAGRVTDADRERAQQGPQSVMPHRTAVATSPPPALMAQSDDDDDDAQE